MPSVVYELLCCSILSISLLHSVGSDATAITLQIVRCSNSVNGFVSFLPVSLFI